MLRYWQQVRQLHVKEVAMVTMQSLLSHSLPPSVSFLHFFASYFVLYQRAA